SPAAAQLRGGVSGLDTLASLGTRYAAGPADASRPGRCALASRRSHSLSGPLLPAQQRVAHRATLLSPVGDGGSLGRDAGQSPHRPPLRRPGSTLAAEETNRAAPAPAAGKALRS